MTLSTMRRTASLVAVAATAATMAAVPVLGGSSASATDLARTTLSIRTLHPAVKPGGSDRVTGNLVVHGATPSGRLVTLEARVKGDDGFTPIAQTTTADRGGVQATVTPAVTTRYRWHYAGDTDARGSVSGIATIRVRTPQHPPTRLPTTLSIRVAHRVVGLNGADVVRSQLRSGRVLLRGRWVVLISRTAGATGWTFEAAQRTGPLARVVFGVQPSTNTAYRTVFLGTPLLRRSRSAVAHVGIRPEVSITATPRQLDPGQSATVSGAVTHIGAPVAGAEVRLLARKVGAHARFKVESTSTTAADGSVSFVVTPDRTTAYRLHVMHSDGVPGGLSQGLREWVRFPTSLSIRGRTTATTYDVSGILRGHGHTLANRLVTLQTEAPGSTTWIDVGTALTAKHGVVRFAEPLAPGTGYRLSYAGAPRYAATTSGTVVS
jgi:hypothetical protein